MASYSGSGSERGRGGGGAGQAGFSGADRGGASGRGGGGGGDRGQMLSRQREAAALAARQAAAVEAARQQAAQQQAAQQAARQRQQQELAAQAALQQAMQQQAAEQAAALEAERFARQQRIMQEQAALSRYQPVRDPAGNIVGQVTPPPEIPMGIIPLIAKMLPFEQRVYSGDPRYNPFDVSGRFDSDNGGRQQQVAPAQDPMTGQERCPEGYYFNETLQACIMDTRSTSPFQPSGSMGVAETFQPSGGYYARQGLLDQPPAGLLEAGFGSPQDFAAANTAFRRRAATRPDIFTDPYNLQGYTLLS